MKKIKELQKKFRVLHDWDIGYEAHSVYSSQCCHNPTTKMATIYKFGKKKVPPDYFLHEILHIAFAAVRDNKETEEMLVQDICSFLLE